MCIGFALTLVVSLFIVLMVYAVTAKIQEGKDETKKTPK